METRMKFVSFFTLLILTGTAAQANLWTPPESLPEIPATAPRTWVLADQQQAFEAFCLQGEGATFFRNIKVGFDKRYLNLPFPPEPESFGDPHPSKRTSDKIDAWREAQDTCNVVAGIASTSTIIWRATGDERYLDKARAYLLKVTEWDAAGTTGIIYNDEANFRLLRLLPEVYDQIRDHLTPEEKARVLAMFKKRGETTFEHLLDKRTGLLVRNSLLVEPSSHPVRFVPMLGLMGLALWDDLPEARDWFAFAYRFYQEQFPPWGGKHGGWAEGLAYWRGTIEHASFQDGLLLIGDEQAYSQDFWKNTFYFPVYFLTPWPSTAFGDTPLAGKIGMEPGIRDILYHAAKIYQDGYLLSYTQLYDSKQELPEEEMEFKLWRKYPTPVEYLLRDFLVSDLPEPEPKPLSELPQSVYLEDIGWVAMHTNLGNPQDDIFLQFKSSPYGSYSHSHADQNAFILNAYGEPYLINAGYREYHRSPHHVGYTRQTLSKNAVLVDGEGQPAQDLTAKGKVVGFRRTPAYTWVKGDATLAYRKNPAIKGVSAVTRDLLMLSTGVVVIRDSIELDEPGTIQVLLHTVDAPAVDPERILVTGNNGQTSVWTQAVDTDLSLESSDAFTHPVDPKYLSKGYHPQHHLTYSTDTAQQQQVIYTVIYPQRKPADDWQPAIAVSADALDFTLPSGEQATLSFTGETPALTIQ